MLYILFYTSTFISLTDSEFLSSTANESGAGKQSPTLGFFLPEVLSFLALVFLRSWLKLNLVDFVVISNPMLNFAAIM